MAKFFPRLTHHAQPGASLFTHGNTSHRHGNGGVPDLLLAGFPEAGIIAKYIAGVPELDSIAEKFDDTLA